MASVRLDNINKVYEGGVVAVHNLSLEVKDKEFVVLVGPSGCGKSTTLRMIAGLEEVSQGTIFIDGQIVNDLPPKDRDIAMVFQNYALYPHMTVYENMAFGLKLRKLPATEIGHRMKEAAEILGIQSLLDRKPKALSGGQRQRVAVGRAIVRKPKVFLFDEPLSNLDAKLRVQMRTEISKLHHRLGATMIYVTHDQTEAMTMADSIVLMKDGYVQQIDSPLRIYNQPANKFVAGFIGSPAMNFVEGRLEKDRGIQFRSNDRSFMFSLARKDQKRLGQFVGRDVVLGLRPEHLTPDAGGISSGKVRVKARVEVVEPMGNETYLHFTTSQNGHLYIARISSSLKPTVGRSFELYSDMSKAHFFDAENERAI